MYSVSGFHNIRVGSHLISLQWLTFSAGTSLLLSPISDGAPLWRRCIIVVCWYDVCSGTGAFFVRRDGGESRTALQHRLERLHEAQGSMPDDETSGNSQQHSWKPSRAGGEDVSGETCGEERWPVPSDADPRQRGLETFEVFVEGTRSRDRRFLPPRTGMLRALQVSACRRNARSPTFSLVLLAVLDCTLLRTLRNDAMSCCCFRFLLFPQLCAV